jgi:hypothetical protein
MTQKNEVLTREEHRISLTSPRRAITQEDYLTITEREIPVDTTEQTWIFEIGEETRVERTTPKLLSSFLKITKWLKHLGTGRIDDSYLEARHDTHHNFRANDIRF